MSLTRTEKITFISTFGAVVFTVIVHLGIRLYFQPNLQYDVGSYYFSNNNAITYIEFTNNGKSDAEDLSLHVEFSTKINDYSTDNPLISMSVISGGKSHNDLVGKIPFIHPGQSVTIYFSVEHHKNTKVINDFIKQITYKDGTPSTGKPFWLHLVLALILETIVIVPLFLYRKKNRNKKINKYYELIEEILNIARQSKENNLSKDEYMNQVSSKIEKTNFRIEGLLLIANSAFLVFHQEKVEKSPGQ
jgi:hypothetical protein